MPIMKRSNKFLNKKENKTMKKSEICGLVVGAVMAFPIGYAVDECVELIMDKVDERYRERWDDKDFKKNHKIYRGLIKTGLYCSATAIGTTSALVTGYLPAKSIGTLIFKD